MKDLYSLNLLCLGLTLVESTSRSSLPCDTHTVVPVGNDGPFLNGLRRFHVCMYVCMYVCKDKVKGYN